MKAMKKKKAMKAMKAAAPAPAMKAMKAMKKKAAMKAITDMVAQLKKEQADEMKHRDWCIDELNQNERQTKDGYDEQEALGTQLEELTLLVKNPDGEVAASKAEIAQTLLEMKHASENREEENKDFQVTVADQKATQEILEKALGKLQAFYNKKAALLAAGFGSSGRQAASQAPPPGFGGEYKKSSGSMAVMVMIEGVIKESKTV